MARKTYGFGKFMLGWLIGIIFTIGTIGILGFYIYKYATVKTFENVLKIEIPLNEDAKSNTIEDYVKILVGALGGSSSKTIEETVDMIGINLGSILTVEENVVDDVVVKTYKYKGIDISSVIKGRLSEVSTNAALVAQSLTLSSLEGLGFTLPDLQLFTDPAVTGATLSNLPAALQTAVGNYTLTTLASDFGITGLTDIEMLSSLLDVKVSGLSTAFGSLVVGDVLRSPNTTVDETYTAQITSFEKDGASAVLDGEIVLADGKLTFVNDENALDAVVTIKNGETTVATFTFAKEAGKLATGTYKLESEETGRAITIFKNEINLYNFFCGTDSNDEIVKVLYPIKISELGTSITETMQDIKLNTLITTSASDTILNAIISGDTTLGGLPEKVNTLKIGDVFPAPEGEDTRPSIIIALSDTNIVDLQTSINTLTLSQMLDTTTNPILSTLGSSTLNTLGTDVGNLTVAQVFPAPEGTDTRHVLIKKLADSGAKILEIGDGLSSIINELKLSDVLTEINFTHTDSFWSLLYITDSSVEGGKRRGGDVLVEEMETAVSNAMDELPGKTLSELNSMGVVTISATDLVKIIGGKQVGAFTLTEIIDAFINSAA